MKSALTISVLALWGCLTVSSSAATKRVACAASSEGCGETIIRVIKNAKADTDLLVETYYLTSRPMIDALLAAKSNKVNVRVVVATAMTQQQPYCSTIEKMKKLGIEVLTTDAIKIIGNKTKFVAITQDTVIEGTFDVAHPPQAADAGSLVTSDNLPWVRAATRSWETLRAASKPYECARVCPGSTSFTAIPACNIPRSDEGRAQECCPTDCVVWMTRRGQKVYWF
jgi:PLD-like domain